MDYYELLALPGQMDITWDIPLRLHNTLHDNLEYNIMQSETGASSAFNFVTTEGTNNKRNLSLLEYAYLHEDQELFIETVDRYNWSKLSPEFIINSIRWAINIELIQIAERILQIGIEQYPNNKEFQKIYSIISPTSSKLQVQPSGDYATENMSWLKRNAKEYQGQWVALKEGNLLAVAKSYKELRNYLGEQLDPKALITPVY